MKFLMTSCNSTIQDKPVQSMAAFIQLPHIQQTLKHEMDCSALALSPLWQKHRCNADKLASVYDALTVSRRKKFTNELTALSMLRLVQPHAESTALLVQQVCMLFHNGHAYLGHCVP